MRAYSQFSHIDSGTCVLFASCFGVLFPFIQLNRINRSEEQEQEETRSSHFEARNES